MTSKKELETKLTDLKRNQAMMEMLLQAGQDLNLAQDEEGLLAALIPMAQEANVSGMILVYIDQDGRGEPEWLEIVAAWTQEGASPLPTGERYYLPEFALTNLWFSSKDQPYFIGDINADDRVDEGSLMALNQMGIRGLAGFPLWQAGRWLGMLSFVWQKPHEFDEREIETYGNLGNLVSLAVATRRLVNRLEQVLAERNEQQQFLRAVLDASPDLIYFKDRDSVFRLCNKAFAHFHKREMGDILGKSAFDWWPSETAQVYRDEDLHVMAGEQVIAQRTIEKSSGTYFFESIKRPMRDENGEVIGLVAFDRDVTERKQTENVLAEERNLLRTLIDALPDHVYAKDTKGSWILANLVQARSLGADNPDDLIGKTNAELYGERIAVELDETDRIVLQSDEPIRLEELGVNAQGEQRWYSSVKAPLRDSHGKPIGLVGLSRDVTEQKILQERAERERKQQAVIDAQKQVICELSTPIIPVMDRIIVMPLIGSIDTMRSREITRALLSGINQYKARIVILDVTGVPLVDSGVASHLNKTIQAARLKGAHTILTGISDAVAETVVELGLDWSGIETLDNMQTGLLTALSRLGIKLARKQM